MSANTLCASCDPCPAGQFISQACTSLSDTKCTLYSTCNYTAQYQSQPGTATHDVVCTPLTPIYPGYYQSKAPTQTTDRTITPITNCTSSQYILTQATQTSDRFCASLTACSRSQYQQTAPTTTSDRTCVALTTCLVPTHYQTAAPTSTSDRVCHAVSTCNAAASYESAPSTATSDVSCSPQPTAVQPLHPLFAVQDAGYFVAVPQDSDAKELSGVDATLGVKGKVSAFFDPVEGNVAVDSYLSEASIITQCAILNSLGPISIDSPTLFVAAQVVDQNMQFDIAPTTVQFVASFNDQLMTFECNATGATGGICSASIPIPADWFGFGSVVGVTCQLDNEVQLYAGSVALLVAKPQFKGTDVVVVLPQRLLNPGEVFTANVWANAPQLIAGYTLKLSVSSQLAIQGVSYDSSYWSASVLQPNSQNIAITALIGDPASVTAAASTTLLLFSVQIRVLPALAAGLALNPVGRVGATVLYLSDITGSPVRPHGVALPTSPTFIDFEGESFSRLGAVELATNTTTALFAYAGNTVLYNSAVFSGQPISTPITVIAFDGLGNSLQLSQGQFDCASNNTAALHVSRSCGYALLNGQESTDAESVALEFSFQGLVATVAFQVWFPSLPLGFVLEDPVLNRLITDAADPTLPCNAVYQSTRLFVNVTYNRGQLQSDYLDATELVFAGLVSNLPAVAGVLSLTDASGNFGGIAVQGYQHGQAILYAPNNALVVEISVSASPVIITRIDGFAVVGLTIGIETGGDYPLAQARVNQRFAHEGDSGFVEASFVTTDGQRQRILSPWSVSLAAPLDAGLQVNGRWATVLAGYNGAEPIATLSNSQCMAMATVAAPVPLDVEFLPFAGTSATAGSLLLTRAGDLAANTPVNIPIETHLVVKRIYADGVQLDATLDSRTVYDLSQSNGLLSVSIVSGAAVVSVAAGSAVGPATLIVRFADNVQTQTLLFTVVKTQQLSVAAYPYPAFPESGATPVSVLHAIFGTSPLAFQSAQLTTTLLLSNADAYDVTAASSFTVDASGTSTASSIASIHNSHVLAHVSTNQLPGSVDVYSTFGGSKTPSPWIVMFSGEFVYVSSLQLSFAETLRGFKSVGTAQASVSGTFSDGTVIGALISQGAPLLPGLLTFTLLQPSSSATVASASGLVTIQGNSESLISLTVSAPGAASTTVTSSAWFASNLDPLAGDADFGNLDGLQFAPTAVGSTVTFDVRVNTGASELRAVEVVVLYDPTVLAVVSALQGSDWAGGAFVSTINDPVGQVALGGTPSGISGVLTIGTITFTATAASSATAISGYVVTISTVQQQSIGGATPREAVAGLGSLYVSGQAPQRRAATPNAQPTVVLPCVNPPCALCASQRQTGDVNGDCVFNLNDASFLLDVITHSVFNAGYVQGLLPFQRAAADADMNGVIDPADSFLLVKIQFDLARFLTAASFKPITRSDGCQLLFSCTVLSAGGAFASAPKTAVYIELDSANSALASQLESSIITSGTLLSESPGNALNGRFIAAQYQGDGVFSVAISGPVAAQTLAVSVLVITLSDTEATASSPTPLELTRIALFLGAPSSVPQLGLISATIPVTAFVSASIQRTAGFNPLLSTANSQTSLACHSLVTCTGLYQQLAAPTYTSDRKCHIVYTQCTASQYQVQPPSPTSDRMCAPLTVCASNQVQVLPATTTSDRTCETVDACASNPCKNGGTCTDQGTSYVCTCPPNYVGNNCQFYDYCNTNGANPCQNGGNCTNTALGAVCSCNAGLPFGCDCCDTGASQGVTTTPASGTCTTKTVGSFTFQCCSETADGVCIPASDTNASSNNNGTSNAGAIAGAVIGGLALLALLVLLLLFIRRRRQQKANRKHDGVDGLASGANAAGDASQEVIDMAAAGPLAVAGKGDVALRNYKRVIGYDQLRYGNVMPLLTTNTDLLKLYDEINVPRPDGERIASYRSLCSKIFQLKVTPHTSEQSLAHALDFIDLPMADLLLEQAIDAFARIAAGESEDEAFEAFYAEIEDREGQYGGIYDDPAHGWKGFFVLNVCMSSWVIDP